MELLISDAEFLHLQDSFLALTLFEFESPHHQVFLFVRSDKRGGGQKPRKSTRML